MRDANNGELMWESGEWGEKLWKKVSEGGKWKPGQVSKGEERGEEKW